jgi:hypothetical protein
MRTGESAAVKSPARMAAKAAASVTTAPPLPKRRNREAGNHQRNHGEPLHAGILPPFFRRGPSQERP